MFNLFSKGRLTALLAVLALGAMNSSIMADDCCNACDACPCPSDTRFYIGAFGGGLYPNSSKLSQMGTAYFPYNSDNTGGPLSVYAHGRTKKKPVGFGGVQLGYEWTKTFGCSNWSLATAVELEAYWYRHTKKGHLINENDPSRLPDHNFDVSFHLDTGIYLANAVFSLNNACFSSLSPYVGVGVGAARLSAKNADSLQVDPDEPGINHFNSRRNDSSWAFAAQAKAGLRYNVCNWFHIFAEYRYLFIDSSNYIFGSTVYEGEHVPTSPWNVKLDNIQYNAWVIGIQYDL